MTVLEIDSVRQLPRSEKLQIMEVLWEDLSRSDSEMGSPAWHRQALEETERRVGFGSEPLMDWAEAKQNLRARFK